MSIDHYEHELDLNELEEIKRSLIAHKQHIEFYAEMGVNYHVNEEYEYITKIIIKIYKMIEIQKDMLKQVYEQKTNSSYSNEYEEILSDGDIPF